MCYFNQTLQKLKNKKSPWLHGLSKFRVIFVGDVIEIAFFKYNLPLVFEGVCLGIRRKKRFLKKDVSFFLRNVILGVGVEVVASFYLNRLYSSRIQYFKRKKRNIYKTRIFYIRYRLNRESRVK